MKPNRHYWHWRLAMFVAVLIVPSALVAWQGWRIVGLDRKNRINEAQRSLEDARAVAVAEIGSDLRDRLERFRSVALNAAPPLSALEFVAWTHNRELVMPWQMDPNAELALRAIEEPEFSRKMNEAYRNEVEKRLNRAADLYLELAQTATNDYGRAFARLQLARVLRLSGSLVESKDTYRDLLSLPSNLVDPGGLSFASTAALALSDTAGRDVFIRVNRDLDYLPVLTLDQAYRWRTVLGTLQNSRDTQLSIDARQGFKTISTHIEALERLQTSLESDVQFGHLRNDFSRLHITEESWLPYGGLLISGLPGSTSLRPVVVAVRSSDVFEAIQAAHKSGPSFTLALGGPGQSLDEARLPGVKIDFAAVNAATIGLDLGNSYYILSILLLSLNLFGAYLLWRDTRRELRVAELRSQFVASVSHELKTPLTAIRMFGEILQTEKAVDAETHAECVDTIVNESERLTRLLNNVLDFSRIEHGQKSYRLESTLLSDVVAAAVKTMQYPLAEQGFDLKMEIDEDTPPVQADRDALKQAVLNLLTNAMKYSGESRDIALRLFRQNGNALIQVADRGIGIPAQEHSRIFEKFYRAAVQENLSISGTGLGLALVAHIVQGHGGTIQVESSPGVGSTFSICLPVHAVES